MDIQTQEQNEVFGSTATALDRIYKVAKDHLGYHITLDNTVPADVGCAEAVSFILKNAGIKSFPRGGFAGTSNLNGFLAGSMDFERVDVPTPGCIIISPTGTSIRGAAHGHVGIVGKYGILSNDSNSGLFREFWTITSWRAYYTVKLGFPIIYYKAVN